MCGIAGSFGVRDASASARMSAAIAHRGPDGAGDAVLHGPRGHGGTLSHRRLSILDLTEGGRQPMASADGRYTIVFNGEIYNFRALRAELAGAGATFHSESDTEVLLEGWARHGADFLVRLRGMFAFAVWDRERGVAHLARDAFGIKPLYVAESGGRVSFASEVRALLASGAVARRMSRDAVAGFLQFGSVPEPHSMIDGVRPLAPGCVAEVLVDDDGARLGTVRRFAAPLPAPPEPEHDPARAAALVRTALADSVQAHLVSDVPVALFLSGGIDSSAVVALAASQCAQPLDTFTVTFGEAAYDESAPARAMAARYRTRHHEVPITGGDLLDALPRAFAAMDQPSLDGLNTFVVSRAVHAEGIKVVLSGLGGDELFAGYPSFRRAARAQRAGRMWRWGGALRHAAASVADRGGPRAEKAALFLAADTPEYGAYHASRALFAAPGARALGAPRIADVAPAPPGFRGTSAVSWYEVTGYMLNTLLRDSDVFSMSHCLELRVPFVDREVARAALAASDAVKLAPGSKPVLVQAVADLLPREVWDRPKQGFSLPFEHWMRGPLRAEVEETLTRPDGADRVGLRPDAVRDVWTGFLARRPGLSWSRPWALYTLVRWAEQLDVSVESAAGA